MKLDLQLGCDNTALCMAIYRAESTSPARCPLTQLPRRRDRQTQRPRSSSRRLGGGIALKEAKYDVYIVLLMPFQTWPSMCSLAYTIYRLLS